MTYKLIVRGPLNRGPLTIHTNQGNPHIRERRISAPVRPGMQAAGVQCLKLQIALASPYMYIRVYTCISISLSVYHSISLSLYLSLSLYIYIYIYFIC